MGQTSSDKLRQTAGGFRPVADLRDGLMREPFNPHCGKQGSYPTGTTPTFRVAGRLNPPPANPMAGRKRPMEDSNSSDSGCQIKSELVLVPMWAQKPVRQPGAMKGKIKIASDFDAPLPNDLQAAFEGRL